MLQFWKLIGGDMRNTRKKCSFANMLSLSESSDSENKRFLVEGMGPRFVSDNLQNHPPPKNHPKTTQKPPKTSQNSAKSPKNQSQNKNWKASGESKISLYIHKIAISL